MQYKQRTSKNTRGCCTPFSLHCFTRLQFDRPPTPLFTFFTLFVQKTVWTSCSCRTCWNIEQGNAVLGHPKKNIPYTFTILYHSEVEKEWQKRLFRTQTYPNFKVSWDLFAAEFQERHCFAGTSDWFGAQMAATSANRAHRCEDLRRVKLYFDLFWASRDGAFQCLQWPGLSCAFLRPERAFHGLRFQFFSNLNRARVRANTPFRPHPSCLGKINKGIREFKSPTPVKLYIHITFIEGHQ